MGGPCEGCEAIFEYGNSELVPIDTLPDFKNATTKLKLFGTIFQRDGKTPAKDIVLYIYHTDSSGYYPTRGNETGWARRHGYLRGWIKTDSSGHYTFYTHRPGAYPGRKDPEHIHPLIKEPGKTSYYIDDFIFDDDPRVTPEVRNNQNLRGGSGILHLESSQGILSARRDIILGLNIPDYD